MRRMRGFATGVNSRMLEDFEPPGSPSFVVVWRRLNYFELDIELLKQSVHTALSEIELLSEGTQSFLAEIELFEFD